MGDSTTAGDIPASFDMVAGYCDGIYKWSDADWSLHPGKVKVRIAVLGTTNDGHVLDVEQGDATPAEAPGWARARRAAGVAPTIYVNLSNAKAVSDAFAVAGEPIPDFWLAHYDNVPAIPAGYVAKQYADEALTGGHYDASVVADDWMPGGTMTAQETYNLIAPLLQQNIVAPQADTNTALKAELAALAAGPTDPAMRVIATKIAVLLEGAAAK